MNAIRSALGTAIGTAMAAVFAGGVSLLVLSLTAEQLPVIKTVGSELRCLVGIPADGSACQRDMIAALRDQIEKLELEQDDLGDQIATQSFAFTQGEELKDGISLVVGTLYEDARGRRGLIRSFCWAIVDAGGLDPRVGLAVMHRDRRIESIATGAAEVALLEMSASEIDAAREACQFPDDDQ